MIVADINARNHSFKSSIFCIKYDLTQNIVSYESPLSLEHVALVRIGIILWQQEDIRDDLAQTIVSGASLERFQRQNLPPISIVFKKISQLALPKFCEEALKCMVKSLGVEILKFLVSQKHLDFSVMEKIHLYWNKICWTQQGTINSINTTSHLVECTKLNVIEKYVIACNNCLDKQISDLIKKLPDNMIESFAAEERFRLVMFWTCRLKGENERFSEVIRQEYGSEVTSQRYIFEWSVRNKYEVAVQYLWANVVDEETKSCLMGFARDAMGRATFTDYARYVNISCFLLSQMNFCQVEELCVRKGHVLLGLLIKDQGRWCHFLVPTTEFMLQYMNKMNIWDALEVVRLCWRGNILDQEANRSVLNDFLIFFKSDVENHFVEICDKFLDSLFAKGDVKSIRSFLSNGTVQNRKIILYNTAGMKYCEQLIAFGRLDLLSLFITEMMPDKDEIKEFQKHFFKVSSFQICFGLIMKDRYQIVDAFLNMFCLKEELRDCKWRLPYEENAKIITYILKWTAKKDTLQLTRIDQFLHWCFDGCEKEIAKCKAEVFDPEKEEYADSRDRILKRISVLIKEGEWLLVEEYMTWAFSTEDKARIFKKQFSRKTEVSIKLMSDLIMRGDKLKSFKRYVAFLPQDELADMKQEIRKSDKLLAIVKELLRRQQSKEVDELLEWWFPVSKDNVKFRKLLMPHQKRLSLVSSFGALHKFRP